MQKVRLREVNQLSHEHRVTSRVRMQISVTLSSIFLTLVFNIFYTILELSYNRAEGFSCEIL